MKACVSRYRLEFAAPAGTSRGVLHFKDTWLLILREEGRIGLGECNLFRGLSHDDRPDFEANIEQVCEDLSRGVVIDPDYLAEWPSIKSGLEQALLSLRSAEPFILFPSPFTRSQRGIPINGLIWMGEPEAMRRQFRQKLEQGFRCIKMKIGALQLEDELRILREIRAQWSEAELTLRVDANGAFTPEQAKEVLTLLEPMGIHSIEQPIPKGNWDAMAELCTWTPVPIALDEELIGIRDNEERERLLSTIGPQYLILKPGLLGGFQSSEEWIRLAERYGAGYWVTSALESNLGLNAIAQWTQTLQPLIPQGLGTGGLYTNNFASPLEVGPGELRYRVDQKWDLHYFSQLCT